MITTLLAKLLGSRNDREVSKLLPLVEQVNSFESAVQALSDDGLKEKTNEFRKQLADGKTLDDLLPEAFAVVREASRRTLGQRHYDVQIMGGIVMHQGKIAEMKTGEGKTLTATLPLYLNALSGKAALLVTVNDYLAKRDSEWMAPIFNLLGLSVSCLQNSMHDAERKEVYNADVIYATNNELGFDYLRDNMKFRLEDYVQRDLYFAIVDEVDSILIDEARTPLIISGSSDEESNLYQKASDGVRTLIKNEDYEFDEKQRSVLLTEQGNDKMEVFFHIENMYAVENINILHHVTQALKAHVMFKKDIDYVVRDDQVLIVDEFTGRILPGRRYSDGLHQSLEAKEGVKVEKESQTLASITLQNFFRLFTKLAGMTGTALTEAEEFHNIYKLDAIAIPTNRALIREDKNDLIFLSEAAKFRAILEDIKERHKKGQPILIGTIAIETSERLSNLLRSEKIPHEVLNAKQHEREAEIVENAGKFGSIMIATNMAGRGTDIKLTPEALEAGGLYILGTERHESRRIDNQLRGRSGRQGDRGESRFYISLEDNLIRVFAGDDLKNKMMHWGMEEDEIIEDKMVSRIIEHSQEKVEKRNFDVRKHLIEYDDVMNQHRKVVYQYRRNVLEGEEQVYELVRDMIVDSVQDIFKNLVHGRELDEKEFDGLILFISKMIHIEKSFLDQQSFNRKNSDELEKDVINFILEQYSLFRKSGDLEMISSAEKWVMLETIDQAWKQHMLNLDHLKEGINLRSWGQKNPLIEYKKEAFVMFEEMMRHIKWEIVHRIFYLDVGQFDSKEIERKRKRELEKIHLQGTSDNNDEPGQVTMRREEPKVGRNDDCSCGSGKKYKKCCGS
ncbi:preprotein translocase subunit SecA [Candidatus Babeliales bacterium]|nr:preprotein translocase subunit SecA [Candidatus Babeliales bacterium]